MNQRSSNPQGLAHRRESLNDGLASLLPGLLFASTCLAGLASAALPSLALAADTTAAKADQTTSVASVIVTARKRAEDVQKIPIATTVLGSAQLKVGKLEEVNEILRFAPNVSIKKDSFFGSDISIRGSVRSQEPEEPGVGLMRDGVYVGGLVTNLSTFYDLDRVEVLRGPQAGLYGRDAVGGAVNFITVKPSLSDVQGYLNVQYGSLNRSEVRGAVNLPIIPDKLAVRLSGLVVDQSQGFVHVVNLGQYADAYHNASGRIRVLYTPVDGLESLTTLEYYKTTGSPSGFVLRNPFDGPFTLGGVTFPGANPRNLGHFQVNTPSVANGEQTQFIEEVNRATDYGTLTGTYGYRKTRFFSSLDNDSTILDVSDVRNRAGDEANHADVRFASRDFDGFHAVAGVTYMDDAFSVDQLYKSGGLFNTNLAQWFTTGLVTANPFGIPVGLPITFLGLTPLGNSGGWSGSIGDSFPATVINHQHLKSLALYMETNYHITSALELWANIRYTRDQKSIHFSQLFGNEYFACPIACPEVFETFLTRGIDPQVRLDTASTFENVSPGGGVNYTITDRAMLYGKVVTGFKAGGFNKLVSSANLLPFNSETTISYETGVKSNWWDNRLLVNADIFYQQRKGALVGVPDPLFAPLGVTYLVNSGLIDNKGAEVDVRAVPIPGLELTASGGYLDSKFKRFVSGGVNFSGNFVPVVYRYSFSASASYKWVITDAWDGFAYLDYSNAWRGFTDPDNLHPLTNPEQLDGRLGVKSAHWSVMGFVDNITDHRWALYESYSGLHVGTISPGRTGGVEVDYTF